MLLIMRQVIRSLCWGEYAVSGPGDDRIRMCNPPAIKRHKDKISDGPNWSRNEMWPFTSDEVELVVRLEYIEVQTAFGAGDMKVQTNVYDVFCLTLVLYTNLLCQIKAL